MAQEVVVEPGDVVLQPLAGRVQAGRGLYADGDCLRAHTSGRLRQNKKGVVWVDSTTRRYAPRAGDAVIGRIAQRQGEHFMVELGAAFPAALGVLDFEGATRRNRPQLRPGDLVYARVTKAGRAGESELSCLPSPSGAGGFGALVGGYVERLPPSAFGDYLGGACDAPLAALGREAPFELVAGQNGLVWVKAGGARPTLAVLRALQEQA